VAIYTDKNHGIAQETRYLHKDHLGSIDTITDENGQLVEKFSFDAWGQRRDPNTWGALTEAQLLDIATQDLTTDRGFTGHEHLDEVQLIHTNGRLYDPVIGRFLSADPYVQAPTFSQSLNRYSYVLNNPLSLVDPSGFFFKKLWRGIKKVAKKVWRGVKKAVKAVGNFIKDNWKPIVATVAGIALGAVTGGLGFAVSGLAGTVLSGAGFGFGSAFSGTLLAGGSVGDAFKAGIKGAVIGGVTAGLTYGVGSLFSGPAGGFGAISYAAKAATHGVVGGLTRIAQGGRFEHGFLAGAFSAGFGPMVNKIPNIAGRVVASAVIGGTAEELGGGKFANGAVTGAFVRLFNHEQHWSFSGALKAGLETGSVGAGFGAGIGGGIGVLVGIPGGPPGMVTTGTVGAFIGGAAGSVTGGIVGVWNYNQQFNQPQSSLLVQQQQTFQPQLNQPQSSLPVQQQQTFQPQRQKICTEVFNGTQRTMNCF
jgi:RHS repeat-associated protein